MSITNIFKRLKSLVTRTPVHRGMSFTCAPDIPITHQDIVMSTARDNFYKIRYDIGAFEVLSTPSVKGRSFIKFRCMQTDEVFTCSEHFFVTVFEHVDNAITEEI